MAKTKKTARELAAMVMREVRASGKCSDLQSVVVHPTGRNYPTWECVTQVNKPDNPNYQLSAACRQAGTRRRPQRGGFSPLFRDCLIPAPTRRGFSFC